MLTPASVASSSRRNPGVRRAPVPAGSPTSLCRIPPRRARRNRPNSLCSAICPVCQRAAGVAGVYRTPAQHTLEGTVCLAGVIAARLVCEPAETRRNVKGNSMPLTATRAQIESPSRRDTRPGPVLLSALLGFFVIGLDASAVNVALPAIGHSFGGSTSALQWIVDAYTLMFAALVLSSGAISDRIGANRVFGIGLAVFTAASAVGGFAPGLAVLIGARVVQGSAAAVMLPSSLALVRQAYPVASERSRAIALWTVGGAVSFAAGPIAGGLLTSGLSWRAIFVINIPVGALTLALLARAPRSPRRAARLDPFGH